MVSWLMAMAWSVGAQAGGLVGVDYVPASFGDQAWADAGQTSGTLVGERDGLLVGPLRPWGGWAGKHDAVLVGLAMARITTASFQGDQRVLRRHSAVRPSLDYRRYLRARDPGQALPWVGAGVHGVLPGSVYENDTATKEEQKDFDETARQDKVRIGATGARVGGGAEVMWDNGLVLGARADLGLSRTQSTDEDVVQVSVLTHTEAALVLGFSW